MRRCPTILILVVGTSFLFGCATTSRNGICVLSTPNHQQDWDRLRAALEFEHIHIPGYKGDLGVFEFCIPSRDAAHARQVIERTIRAGSLTVRVTKSAVDPQVYEVYEEGKKVREESYTIKQGA